MLEVADTRVHCEGSAVSTTFDGFVASYVQHSLGGQETAMFYPIIRIGKFQFNLPFVVKFGIESATIDVSEHMEILWDVL